MTSMNKTTGSEGSQYENRKDIPSGAMASDDKESRDNVKSFNGAKNKLENTAAEGWDMLSSKAEETFGKAKGMASDISGQVQEGASAALDTVSTTVKRYPYQSILVGFGLGCAVGALLANIRRT